MDPQQISSEGAEDLQVISEIAERRREDLKQALSKPVPDFIVSTEQAEVVYTIHPNMLPYSQMDLGTLASRLRQKYHVKFQNPSLPPSFAALSNTEGAGDDAKYSAAKDLLAGAMPDEDLTFVQGRLAIGPDDVVAIRQISMNSESVHVAVTGDSKVADLVVKEVVEELWASTGIPKRWDSIYPSVQMIRYGTATKVDFGVHLEEFLSVGCRSFITSQVLDGKNFAARSVARSARDKFQPPPNTLATWTLDDLKLVFHVFNRVNGRAENSQFRLSVSTRDEEGTGIFIAISEMPFDEHVECMRALRDYLSK